MLNNVRALRPGGGKAVARLLACSMFAGGSLLTVSNSVATAASVSFRQEIGGEGSAACTARAATVRGKSDLRIVCGGANAVRVGEVDSYETATNRASGALAVRVSSYGRIRVFFAFPDAAGRPFVQELTRDLARAAGRNADAGLENVSIDFERFGSAMAIGVADRGNADSPQSTLDLTRYLTLGKQILPSVPASLANPDPSNKQVVQ